MPKTNDMRVILAAVMSLDGKITRDEQVHSRRWISAEDKKFFDDLVSESDVVIVGRKSYQNMRPALNKTKQYYVYTQSPEKFKDEIVNGFVEFTNQDPAELLQNLQAAGHVNILVLGGTIHTLFLQAKLIDELYITIEPLVFGRGRSLFDAVPLDAALTLKTVTKLNASGTVLLHYTVKK